MAQDKPDILPIPDSQADNATPNVDRFISGFHGGSFSVGNVVLSPLYKEVIPDRNALIVMVHQHQDELEEVKRELVVEYAAAVQERRIFDMTIVKERLVAKESELINRLKSHLGDEAFESLWKLKLDFSIRLMGYPRALTVGELGEYLGLSGDQKLEIRSIQTRVLKINNEAMTKSLELSKKEMLDVLTPQQRMQLEAVVWKQ